MQPGQEAEEEVEDDEDDEEYSAEPIAGPGVPAPSAIAPSLSGTKRGREEDDTEDLAGDYGEVNENGESVLKKARGAVDGEQNEA